MKDPRINKLANLLINHSCALRAGENVLIESIGAPKEIIIALIHEVRAVGANPFVSIKDDQIIRELCSCYTEEYVKMMADFELYTLKQMDAFIGIRAFMNISELSDVPRDKINNVLKYYMQPVHLEQKNEYTRSVLLRWPTAAMAQRADMSTEAFEDFYFNACIIDYTKLEKMMEPIVALMQKTDKVRIVGPGDTDISFSINGMPKNKNAGRHNIPDGEISTAPTRNSVEGRIKFNVPSNYYGTTFENICLDFKNGKVINAASNETEKINKVLNIDAGARYTGEFAFGLNPYITKPMKDILFDEKIRGSIHIALGNAYKKCDNSNRSAIHWDLILIQTPEWGGGNIYFDDKLIRKDGEFVNGGLFDTNLKDQNTFQISK